MLAYLDRSALPAAEALSKRIRPYLNQFNPDAYAALSEDARNDLRQALTDTIAEIDRITPPASAASEKDRAWARRNASIARDLEAFFASWPTGVTGQGTVPEMARPMEIRDRTMADTVRWALEQEGTGGRILIFAHNAHISAEPIRGGIWKPLDASPPRLMGTHLRAELGDDLRILASSAAQTASSLPQSGQIPDVDGALAAVGMPLFLLDLRSAKGNPAVSPWVDQVKSMRANLTTEIELIPAKAFDGLVYLDRLTPETQWERD